MSENVITPILTEENNGSLNLLGMQVKISDIIGDKLVDQFMATITPQQMDAITKVLFNEIFETKIENLYDKKEEKFVKTETTVFKTKIPNTSGSYWERDKETTIYSKAKSTLISRYNKLIEEKIQEYFDTDEYKEKAAATAKEIIDYALEGYKKDIIANLRRKLVQDPFTFDTGTSAEEEIRIRDIVHEEMNYYHNSNDQNNVY